jgi:hypothetical protein
MAVANKDDLLKILKVREEIDRYKWVKSQHLGHDIGFEEAAREWIDRHAEAWIKYHARKKTVGSKSKA